MAEKSVWKVPDQTGRTAVVTGANSGIGLEVAKQLAQAGADVVLAVRDPDKGRVAAQAVRVVSHAAVTCEQVDVSSLESVHDFALRIDRADTRVDMLINNAGIMDIPRRAVSADGFELQLATNFLGPFALTALLADRLRASQGRVVGLGTLAVSFPTTKLDLSDLQLERRYSGMRAYGQSKLATLLFAGELGRRSDLGHWGIESTAAHPGSAHTNLQITGKRFGKSNDGRRPVNATTLIMRLPGLHHGPDKGAESVVRAATDPQATSGDYFGPSGTFGTVGAPGRARFPSAARNTALAQSLWDAATALTGVRWPDTSSRAE
jgi:NAD(P)-dependent dehydrogenase (short-subunit alcohol dehydrogenase family)